MPSDSQREGGFCLPIPTLYMAPPAMKAGEWGQIVFPKAKTLGMGGRVLSPHWRGWQQGLTAKERDG